MSYFNLTFPWKINTANRGNVAKVVPQILFHLNVFT